MQRRTASRTFTVYRPPSSHSRAAGPVKAVQQRVLRLGKKPGSGRAMNSAYPRQEGSLPVWQGASITRLDRVGLLNVESDVQPRSHFPVFCGSGGRTI